VGRLLPGGLPPACWTQLDHSIPAVLNACNISWGVFSLQYILPSPIRTPCEWDRLCAGVSLRESILGLELSVRARYIRGLYSLAGISSVVVVRIGTSRPGTGKRCQTSSPRVASLHFFTSHIHLRSFKNEIHRRSAGNCLQRS
jgi:hypothetical protein